MKCEKQTLILKSRRRTEQEIFAGEREKERWRSNAKTLPTMILGLRIGTPYSPTPLPSNWPKFVSGEITQAYNKLKFEKIMQLSKFILSN